MMSEGIIENDTSLLANKNSAVDMGELKSERYSLQVLGNTGTENRKNRLTKRYSLQPGT